jgi:DNA adenine methylase
LSNSERFPMETLNDASGDITHFFKVMRDHEAELIRAVKLTPWSYDEWKASLIPTDEPIERARRFYVRLWASVRPFDSGDLSFRRQKVLSSRENGKEAMTPAAQLFARSDHLWQVAKRLKGVAIDNMDALDFIHSYDYERAFFYVDPPYPFHTRKNQNRPAYPIEFATGRNDERDFEAHKALADTLNQIEGYAIVSGYPCDWYAGWYEDNGWERVDREARINGGINTAVESLWLCPKTQEALARRGVQKTLL